MTRERAFGWFGSVAMQLFALGALGVSPYMRYDDLPEPANAVPLHQYVPVIETIRAPTPKQRTLAATRAIPKAALDTRIRSLTETELAELELATDEALGRIGHKGGL